MYALPQNPTHIIGALILLYFEVASYRESIVNVLQIIYVIIWHIKYDAEVGISNNF